MTFSSLSISRNTELFKFIVVYSKNFCTNYLFFSILLLIFISTKDSLASICLLSVELPKIATGSEIELYTAKNKFYIKADSKLFYLDYDHTINNPKEVDLKVDRIRKVYPTTVKNISSFVNADKRFYYLDQHQEVVNAPNNELLLDDSFLDIYFTHSGVLFNLDTGLHRFKTESNTLSLISGKLGINKRLDKSKLKAFFSADDNRIYRLVGQSNHTQLEKMFGFEGDAIEILDTRKGLILIGIEKGGNKREFYKWKEGTVDLHCCWEKISGQYQGSAMGVFPIHSKTEVLLSTDSAVYRLNENERIEAISDVNIGRVNHVYNRTDSVLLHSSEGLFKWVKDKGISPITTIVSVIKKTFDSKHGLFVLTENKIYLWKDGIAIPILKDISTTKSIPRFIPWVPSNDLTIFESGQRVFFGTDEGVFFSTINENKLVSRPVPGNINRIINGFVEAYGFTFTETNKDLFRLVDQAFPDPEIDIIEIKSQPGPNIMDASPVLLEWKINPENFPCSTVPQSFNQSLQVTRNGKIIQTKIEIRESDIKGQYQATIPSGMKKGDYSVVIVVEDPVENQERRSSLIKTSVRSSSSIDVIFDIVFYGIIVVLIVLFVLRDKPIKIFVSYSHKDSMFLEKGSLLGSLQENNNDNIEYWWDDKIKGGEFWNRKIISKIQGCDIALLLVSQSFLDSDYCMENEVPMLLDKSKCIIPVILSKCKLEKHKWLKDRQCIPTIEQNITDHFEGNKDRQLIFQEIRRTILVRAQDIRKSHEPALLRLIKHRIFQTLKQKYRKVREMSMI